MSSIALHDDAYRRDLSDHLVLRWSTPADIDELARLYSLVFRNKVSEPPNPRVAAWTRVLMSGSHPLLGPTDFAVVEDTSQQTIIAATNLMAQTWEYAGIRLPVGRPEVVASEAAYRQRGLIRAIFELIHARSAARGHLALGITGIPYYYRQFGYEYALELGGGASLPFTAIPPLKPQTAEPFSLRDATLDDLPTVMALYEQECGPALVSTVIDAAYWRFIISGGLPPDTNSGWRTQMIGDSSGETCGYVLTHPLLWGSDFVIKGLAVRPGVSLHGALPSVLRALRTQAQALPMTPGSSAVGGLRFELGSAHLVFTALGEERAMRTNSPYAWYVRVPDLPALIRGIAPALERRIAASTLVGYTGEIKINLYRGGLRLVFEHGRLRAAEDWQIPIWNGEAEAGSPPLVFLQLVFGHRSLNELRDAFPDVWVVSEHVLLLQTLFPKQPSFVMPLD